MKLKLALLLVIFVCFSCKAQITPLYKAQPDMPEGTHYKDLDGDLNKFEGTWQWQRNDSIVTMVLRKEEDVYEPDDNQYEDYIIGEYKFTLGGQVIQDYLPRLADSNLPRWNHYIIGNYIMDNNTRPYRCPECNPNERRLAVYFDDPEREHIPGRMFLRHRVIDGVEQLEVYFGLAYTYISPSADAPKQNRVPFGDYVFIKQ